MPALVVILGKRIKKRIAQTYRFVLGKVRTHIERRQKKKFKKYELLFYALNDKDKKSMNKSDLRMLEKSEKITGLQYGAPKKPTYEKVEFKDLFGGVNVDPEKLKTLMDRPVDYEQFNIAKPFIPPIIKKK